MASSVESIEISKFDPSHPALSPDPERRPFVIKSVGVFAVVGTRYPVYVVCRGEEGWSIPAGRVEPTDQDPLCAALREFTEETSGSIDQREVTHMGIVSRISQGGDLSRSLVFRAKLDLYNFGIDHGMDTYPVLIVTGDKEVKYIMFRPIDQMLPAPTYRPDINIPVVRAFSQISGAHLTTHHE